MLLLKVLLLKVESRGLKKYRHKIIGGKFHDLGSNTNSSSATGGGGGDQFYVSYKFDVKMLEREIFSQRYHCSQTVST